MEHAGFEKRVTAEGVAQILANALAALPSLGSRELLASWAGLRPFPQDGVPVIGELEPGLFVASGHHRNGILLTPETARLVALAVQGKAPPELAPFAPRR
jgi:glycine oxidase